MRFEGWTLTCWLALAVGVMTSAVLAAPGTDEECARVLIRATARSSLVFFLLAFAARPLRRVWRSGVSVNPDAVPRGPAEQLVDEHRYELCPTRDTGLRVDVGELGSDRSRRRVTQGRDLGDVVALQRQQGDFSFGGRQVPLLELGLDDLAQRAGCSRQRRLTATQPFERSMHLHAAEQDAQDQGDRYETLEHEVGVEPVDAEIPGHVADKEDGGDRLNDEKRGENLGPPAAPRDVRDEPLHPQDIPGAHSWSLGVHTSLPTLGN